MQRVSFRHCLLQYFFVVFIVSVFINSQCSGIFFVLSLVSSDDVIIPETASQLFSPKPFEIQPWRSLNQAFVIELRRKNVPVARNKTVVVDSFSTHRSLGSVSSPAVTATAYGFDDLAGLSSDSELDQLARRQQGSPESLCLEAYLRNKTHIDRTVKFYSHLWARYTSVVSTASPNVESVREPPNDALIAKRSNVRSNYSANDRELPSTTSLRAHGKHKTSSHSQSKHNHSIPDHNTERPFVYQGDPGRAEALEGQLLNDAIAAVREKHGATIPPDNFSGAVASKGSQQAEPVTPNLRVPYKQTTVALRNVGNVQYINRVHQFGTVGFGTPPQFFEMVFDTGSSDIWVAAPTCQAAHHNCPTRHFFNATKSSTLEGYGRNGTELNVTLAYGKGVVVGTFVTDFVTLDKLSIGRQNFLLVNYEESLDGAYFDGVFGLGFPPISYTNSSAFEGLKEQNSFYHPVFALILSREDQGTSKLILGPIHLRQKELRSFWWVPIVKGYPGWWTVKAHIHATPHRNYIGSAAGLSSISPYRNTSRIAITAILDSGTSFLTVPNAEYADVMALLIPPGAQRFCWVDPQTELLYCHCSVTTYFSPLVFEFDRTHHLPKGHPWIMLSKSTGKVKQRQSIILNPEDYVTVLPSATEVGPDVGASENPVMGNHSSFFNTQELNASRLLGAVNNQRQLIGRVCEIDIVPGPNRFPWILGDTFLRTVDALFDASPPHPVVGLRRRSPKKRLDQQLYRNAKTADDASDVSLRRSRVPKSLKNVTTPLSSPPIITASSNDFVLSLLNSSSHDADTQAALSKVNASTSNAIESGKEAHEKTPRGTGREPISGGIGLMAIALGMLFVLLWTCGCFKTTQSRSPLRLAQVLRTQSSNILAIFSIPRTPQTSDELLRDVGNHDREVGSRTEYRALLY